MLKILGLLVTQEKYSFILDHEWLQFDLGPPTTVTGLITRGQGDKKRYVTSYSMSYSNDSSTWHFYKDANHLESKVSLILRISIFLYPLD